jgi:hypothetical protein
MMVAAPAGWPGARRWLSKEAAAGESVKRGEACRSLWWVDAMHHRAVVSSIQRRTPSHPQGFGGRPGSGDAYSELFAESAL